MDSPAFARRCASALSAKIGSSPLRDWASGTRWLRESTAGWLTLADRGWAGRGAGSLSPAESSARRAPRPRLALRRRAERVLGPGVSRIAAHQLAARLRVDVGPEAGQVLGHLLGAAVGREQVQQHLHLSVQHARRVALAEELLHAHG